MESISTIITFCSSFCFGFFFSFLIFFSMYSGVPLPRVDFFYNKIKNICLKSTYNLLYIYSVCQIKCNYIYNYFSPYVKYFQTAFELLLKKDNKNDTSEAEPSSKINMRIEVYDNSTLKPLFERNLTKMSKDNLTCLDTLSDYTMIVTDLSEDNINNTKKIKKIMIICDTYLEKYDFNFELSDITFVALYLNYNNERYNINLKMNDFNFYVVGNIINKTFLQYYMKNILHNDIFINTDTESLKSSYKLELMDHEVNIMSLTESQYIIIEKNGYNVEDANCYLEDKISNKVEDIIIDKEPYKIALSVVNTEPYDLLDDDLGDIGIEE